MRHGFEDHGLRPYFISAALVALIAYALLIVWIAFLPPDELSREDKALSLTLLTALPAKFGLS
ncbi:hypothetical protein SAMN05443551_4074 [Marivita hallyeonensis]|uniref:Uncharacterized protein n=1 Tax=Marivita hallyeonensis TaxID=996342 RepID=A0A1M5XQZ5_9RHOB|nr:hypothetical protein SAMN05443551_4074 [Marivita hallyeonensis]